MAKLTGICIISKELTDLSIVRQYKKNIKHYLINKFKLPKRYLDIVIFIENDHFSECLSKCFESLVHLKNDSKRSTHCA